MPDTGTHDIQSLLDVEHQSVADFGLQTVREVLQRDLDAHRELTAEMTEWFAEESTDRQRIYGASQQTEMQEVDEYAEGYTQESHESGETAFPLRKFVHPVGWTNDFETNATPADMAQATLNAEKADVVQIRKQIQRAVFKSTNYTYVDHLVDDVSLDVKRQVNADGDPIPDGPGTQTFDPDTHTHYNAESGLTNSGLAASVDDLVEHGHSDSPKLFINQGDETAMRGLDDFKEYVDARLTLQDNEREAQSERLDRSTPLNNRAIGIFRAAEVWIKPWIPSGYMWICDIGDPDKPLVKRQHESEGLRGLRLAASISDYPLVVDTMENYYGFGVWTRTNGVIHHFENGTYQEPTFT